MESSESEENSLGLLYAMLAMQLHRNSTNRSVLGPHGPHDTLRCSHGQRYLVLREQNIKLNTKDQMVWYNARWRGVCCVFLSQNQNSHHGRTEGTSSLECNWNLLKHRDICALFTMVKSCLRFQQ